MDKEFYEKCKDVNEYWQNCYEYNRSMIAAEFEKEFAVIEGFLACSYDIGTHMDKLIPGPKKPVLQFALLRIHEKAIKIAREVKILLENGSASGAMARWRTLYEFSVVSSVLIKYPDLAIKYIEYEKVDNYKCAKKLVEYKGRLNLQNYNMDAYPEIVKSFEEVKVKYGWDGHRDYEWAQNDDIKNPNLFSMAAAVELEHLYAYVDESHKYNHPSPRYLLNDRGAKVPEDDLTYLFSPFEMDLPIQLIVCSLHQVNCMLIQGYSQLDNADTNQMLSYLDESRKFPEAIIELATERLVN